MATLENSEPVARQTHLAEPWSPDIPLDCAIHLLSLMGLHEETLSGSISALDFFACLGAAEMDLASRGQHPLEECTSSARGSITCPGGGEAVRLKELRELADVAFARDLDIEWYARRVKRVA